MLRYTPPLRDIQFLLEEMLPTDQLCTLPGYEEATPELLRAVVEEAGRLTAEVILPTNGPGDQEGCTYHPEDCSVTTPACFKTAWKAYREGGWTGLSAPVEFGGQGLPELLRFVMDEMMSSTNLSFGMYPGLSHGAVSALYNHASDEMKQQFLPKLVSGEWTGTMCLTEPQCGTDLRLIRTRAQEAADGSYRLNGTKIWITGGEHDLSDNIIHLVLAKLPGAPESTKGISMFIVPKFLPDSGERNGISCGGLEHKMGIKGSATCVINLEDAKGWLVGQPNEGMRYMFTMMNGARLMVGMQGLGTAEAAWQIAIAFARERLQSRAIGGPKAPDKAADPIIVHADVRRMLLRQRVVNEGCRAMAYWVGYHGDNAHANPDPDARQQSDDIVQFMTPVVKAFLTDEGFTNANWALQTLGGSGFTTDWGVEQLVRDCRIARIYEGTNGIQALDLVGRKLALHGGRLFKTYVSTIQGWVSEQRDLVYGERLSTLVRDLIDVTREMGKRSASDPDFAAAASSPYLRLVALVSLAWVWQQADVLATGRESDPFYASKRKSAAHFFDKILCEVPGLIADIQSGADTLMAHSEEELAIS